MCFFFKLSDESQRRTEYFCERNDKAMQSLYFSFDYKQKQCINSKFTDCIGFKNGSPLTVYQFTNHEKRRVSKSPIPPPPMLGTPLTGSMDPAIVKKKDSL